MEPIETIDGIREQVSTFKKEEKTIALVPTMGALHPGHLSLIDLAQNNADEVVVSIYVNPKQFSPDEDFDQYPRTLQEDLQKCEEYGVSAVFAPTDEVMYPGKSYLSIQVQTLNDYMDGGSRSGFFEGILTVVNKLFNIVEPNIAVFGQKDIQQFNILQQMAQEFNHDVELKMGPIIRANDGLAISSRNQYLSEEQRNLAPGLYRALKYIRKQVGSGINKPGMLLDHQKDELTGKGFEIDYLRVFSSEEMEPVDELLAGRKYILAGAVFLGETRLIDNMVIET